MPAPRSPSTVDIVEEMLARVRQREQSDAPFVLEYSPADDTLRPWLWSVDLSHSNPCKYLQCRCCIGPRTRGGSGSTLPASSSTVVHMTCRDHAVSVVSSITITVVKLQNLWSRFFSWSHRGRVAQIDIWLAAPRIDVAIKVRVVSHTYCNNLTAFNSFD